MTRGVGKPGLPSLMAHGWGTPEVASLGFPFNTKMGNPSPARKPFGLLRFRVLGVLVSSLTGKEDARPRSEFQELGLPEERLLTERLVRRLAQDSLVLLLTDAGVLGGQRPEFGNPAPAEMRTQVFSCYPPSHRKEALKLPL